MSSSDNREQPPLIRALLCPDAYDHPVERLELVETHISWLLLTGPFRLQNQETDRPWLHRFFRPWNYAVLPRGDSTESPSGSGYVSRSDLNYRLD